MSFSLCRGRPSFINERSTDDDHLAGTAFPGCFPEACAGVPEPGAKRQNRTSGRTQPFLAGAKHSVGCETQLFV